MNRTWIALLDSDEDDVLLWKMGINRFADGVALREFIAPHGLLAYVEEHHELPSVIIMDGVVPKGDELDWLIKFKEHAFQRVPIAMLGGDDMMAHKEQYLHAGARDCFYKPNNVDELKTLIENILQYTLQ